jgi:DNA-directed RNA polymerase sigma subunit (sigma70/sigma32)
MPEEIATEMGVEVEKIYQIEKISQDTISLELPIGDEDDHSRLSDFIADDKIISPDQEVSHSILDRPDALKSSIRSQKRNARFSKCVTDSSMVRTTPLKK